MRNNEENIINVEANYIQFLIQTSENQKLFRWCSEQNDYIILKGQLQGHLISDIVVDYRDEFKEFLEELYYDEETNYNTKQIIKEIIKMYFKKKKDSN